MQSMWVSPHWGPEWMKRGSERQMEDIQYNLSLNVIQTTYYTEKSCVC